MQKDTYTKIVMTIAAFALCLIAVGPFVRPIPVKADTTQDMSGVVKELWEMRRTLNSTKDELAKINKNGLKVKQGGTFEVHTYSE